MAAAHLGSLLIICCLISPIVSEDNYVEDNYDRQQTTTTTEQTTTTIFTEDNFVEVRLVNPDGEVDRRFGRVEVYNKAYNAWGTVCTSAWNELDAAVVCRALGHNLSRTIVDAYTAGDGAGPIWLGNVECIGTEQNIGHCKYEAPRCTDHRLDAGVRCISLTAELEVHLVTPDAEVDRRYGRVEVHDKATNTWGTICSQQSIWGGSTNNANVVCRMLGYNVSRTIAEPYQAGGGIGSVFLSNVECKGAETNIGHCRRSGWMDIGYSCDHRQDVGVRCISLETNLEVRLVKPSGEVNHLAGRVEISENGTSWGTICDDSWDTADATVVCRMLGHDGSQGVAKAYTAGGGSGPILLSDVECNGNEKNVGHCKRYFTNTCVHAQDAGVECNTPAH